MVSKEENICRLCGKSYLFDEIIGQIDNESLEIEKKLIACCQWAELNHSKCEDLPKNVCISCFEKLQQCWDFAEEIEKVQLYLMSQILNENKSGLECGDNCSQDVLSKCEVSTDSGEMDTKSEIELITFSSFGEVFADFINETENNAESDSEMKPNLMVESADIPLTDSVKHDELVSVQRKPRANKFLDAIPKDDRNSDGTIKPEAIERLNLDNWTFLQHQCYLCLLQFADFVEWRDHIQMEHPGKPVKHACSICTTVYGSRGHLKRHIANNHQRHLKYCCRKCNTFFWDSQSKRRHSPGCKAIVQDIPSLCDICGKEFKSQPLLRFHRKSHFLVIKRTYECYMCNKQLHSKYYLKYHIQITHVNVKPLYKCDICHREFRARKIYKRHIKIHSENFPFKCPQCGKQFRFPEKLRTHIRTDTGEKPFKCLLCSYRCCDNSNMCKHMRQKHGTTQTEVLQRQRSERE